MMPTNRRRLFVYAPLVAVVLFFLMHPYFRQRMFGPKIKGEPLWIWQQEFRASVARPAPPTFWNKALAFIGINGEGIRWIGSFPRSDPAMLPVLLSLADDPSERIRSEVASALSQMPVDEKVVDTLLRLTKDDDSDVRIGAASALSRHGKKALVALPRMRELLSDSRAEMQLTAASAVRSMAGYDEQAVSMMKELIRTSTVRQHRIYAVSILASMGKETDAIFSFIVSLCHTDPDAGVQNASVRYLGEFGPKALPEMLGFLDRPSRDLRFNALCGIQMIGPAALAGVPRLLQLQKRESDPYSLHMIGSVLHGIDSKQFPTVPEWP